MQKTMKVAAVTGGGKGIGKGFVEYFLDQGFMVFALVREMRSEYTNADRLTYIACDVADDASIAKAKDVIAGKTDHIDVLVNNAGLNKDTATGGKKALVSKLKDLERKYLLDLFNVNTISPLIMVKTFLPLFTGAQSFVINISSCRASYHDEIENTSANYGYRASKTALNMMTFCSVMDLPKSVKTFAVHPGSVKTDMNPEGSQTPYEQAEKIFAITKNWQDDFNGKFMRYDGTLYPL